MSCLFSSYFVRGASHILLHSLLKTSRFFTSPATMSMGNETPVDHIEETDIDVPHMFCLLLNIKQESGMSLPGD